MGCEGAYTLSGCALDCPRSAIVGGFYHSDDVVAIRECGVCAYQGAVGELVRAGVGPVTTAR